ncbi:hypothetical protein, partial [Mycobacterium marinum]|uniref:hypothetical protein n=1 Tax=Mycobacterium marinum TaxID=1781 RepID=UPI0035692C42
MTARNRGGRGTGATMSGAVVEMVGARPMPVGAGYRPEGEFVPSAEALRRRRRVCAVAPAAAASAT